MTFLKSWVSNSWKTGQLGVIAEFVQVCVCGSFFFLAFPSLQHCLPYGWVHAQHCPKSTCQSLVSLCFSLCQYSSINTDTDVHLSALPQYIDWKTRLLWTVTGAGNGWNISNMLVTVPSLFIQGNVFLIASLCQSCHLYFCLCICRRAMLWKKKQY